MMIPGVILAGGAGRRMGGADKALLGFGQGTLLAHVQARFEPQVARLALNANGDPASYAAFGLPVLADALPDPAGPLAGVLAAMDWAAGLGADQVVTVAVDTPFLPGDLVPQLLLAAELAQVRQAVAATRRGAEAPRLQPTFGLWPVAARDDLRAALQAGLRRMRDWTETGPEPTARAVFALPEGGIDPFLNLNRPEDLEEARRLLG